ncbi:hypothetical protein [Verrucosispora sp. TAA-831]|uniref:hypothetical protein n=1 Tax=Verrucosispora sp. TAA-831 TaxID=3422227 RepID=UPI003D6E25B2
MRSSRLPSRSAKRAAADAAAGVVRTSTLNRGTGLRQAGRLNRSGQLSRTSVTVSRPVDTGPDAATVAVVVDRDQGCCVRCGRYVVHGVRGRAWSVQHRRARQCRDRRPDTNTPPNLIVLCGSATTGCHGWVESRRAAA